ncbi:MAG: hypothetical protein WD278_12430 [Pirellulales bacterium]
MIEKLDEDIAEAVSRQDGPLEVRDAAGRLYCVMTSQQFQKYVYDDSDLTADDMQFIHPAIGEILAGQEEFDLAGIVNSDGDSIYIILARHTRQLNDEVSGYAYVHNCPRASLIEGTLLKLTAK